MSVGEWIALGGAAVTVVGWLIRLERRLGAAVTRDEHEKICQRRQEELRVMLGEIGTTVRRFADDFDRHKDRVTHDLGHIRTQVAVLRTKQGENPFDETGRFRREP